MRARCEADNNREGFEIYVTDALRHLLGGHGRRYYDAIHTKPVKETRSAEEIIDMMKKKINGGVE